MPHTTVSSRHAPHHGSAGPCPASAAAAVKPPRRHQLNVPPSAPPHLTLFRLRSDALNRSIARIYPWRPTMSASSADSLHSKVAAVTLAFWVMKIAATTLGETAGDLLSMTLGLGYVTSSAILLAIFVGLLALQLSAPRFHPLLFWCVVLATSTAGTTMSDLLDRTLGLGYATGASLLAGCLALVLLAWRWSEKSISVSHIASGRAEVFYWTAVLFSNTLGTALGDFLADDSGLGFIGGALLIGGLIALTALATRIKGINRVVLFWIAFVLTRPFGATFGDLLTKPLEKGGLGFGTVGSSLVLFAILATLVALPMLQRRAQPAS